MGLTCSGVLVGGRLIMIELIAKKAAFVGVLLGAFYCCRCEERKQIKIARNELATACLGSIASVQMVPPQ